MPAVITTDSWNCEFAGQEPWPDDVKLYQPYEVEQILMPDTANCLAVQAFLKMCKLDFSIEYKANAEDMSPSGKVPFIKCGACLVADLEPITNFVNSKGYSLTEDLDNVQKADMRAYMSLVNTVIGNAENYITWVDNATYSSVTKPRYGSVHPFPLNHILTYLKRQSAIKRLRAVGWYQKSLDKVYEEVDRGCCALSERLGTQKFFFGDKPTELDALVFGHVYATLTYPGCLAGLELVKRIRQHPLLLEHCRVVMYITGSSEKIENSILHGSPSRTIIDVEGGGDTESNDFVFDYNDEGEEISRDLKNQACQQYCIFLNEPNPIYVSLFGEVKTPHMDIGDA